MKNLLRPVGMLALGLLFLCGAPQKVKGETALIEIPNPAVAPVYTTGSSIGGTWDISPVTEYTITLRAADGTIRGSNILTTVNQKLSSLPEVSREGYNFKGWYTKEFGGTSVTTETEFYSDTTIYAHWELIEADFLEFAFAELSDTSATLVVKIPNRFVGVWGISVGTSGTSLPAPRQMYHYARTTTLETPITGLMPETTYYYSVYYVSDAGRFESGIKIFTTKKGKEYVISFHPNGGTISGQSQLTTERQQIPVFPGANRNGHVFDGWYTSPTGGTKMTTTDMFEVDRMLYAHWIVIEDPETPDVPDEPDVPDIPIEPDEPEIIITVKKVSINSVKNTAKGKALVKWKTLSAVNGYQVAFSTSKSFPTKKTSMKGAAGSSYGKTITGLKKGNVYYVRVRAYKIVDGIRYYGGWSTVKKIRVTK